MHTNYLDYPCSQLYQWVLFRFRFRFHRFRVFHQRDFLLNNYYCQWTTVSQNGACSRNHRIRRECSLQWLQLIWKEHRTCTFWSL